MGKGKKFTIFRGEFNHWQAVQLEGSERIDLSDKLFCHVIQVAKILGLE